MYGCMDEWMNGGCVHCGTWEMRNWEESCPSLESEPYWTRPKHNTYWRSYPKALFVSFLFLLSLSRLALRSVRNHGREPRGKASNHDSYMQAHLTIPPVSDERTASEGKLFGAEMGGWLFSCNIVIIIKCIRIVFLRKNV